MQRIANPPLTLFNALSPIEEVIAAPCSKGSNALGW
jgi:hypothetical protein